MKSKLLTVGALAIFLASGSGFIAAQKWCHNPECDQEVWGVCETYCQPYLGCADYWWTQSFCNWDEDKCCDVYRLYCMSGTYSIWQCWKPNNDCVTPRGSKVQDVF